MLDTIMNTFTGVVSSIRLLDVLDIVIVAFAIYKLLYFISGTRAMQLVKGLTILILAMFAAHALDLYTVYFILSNALRYGAFAIIVIFYPELRRVLEYIGRGTFSITRMTRESNVDEAGRMINEVSDAISYFSETRTGALIVFEKNTKLGEVLDHGTIMDAFASSMLLKSIFYEGTSLHDGAVVIRDAKVYAAGCILPVSQNKDIEKTLGTRHRAGLGITEVSDAVAVIVSEETGVISVASRGKLSRHVDEETLKQLLTEMYISKAEKSGPSKVFSYIFGRSDDE